MWKIKSFVAVYSVALLCNIALALPLKDEPKVFGPSGLPTEKIFEALRTQKPNLYRSVGSTSLVFFTDLEGPIDAAVRPETYNLPRGHRAELAAYLISTFLRFDNVPPVVWWPLSRDVFLSTWKSRITREDNPAGQIKWANAEEPVQAPAVSIYWVAGLTELGFDTPQGIDLWSSWLAQKSSLPRQSIQLAHDISDMVVFDLLIANFDRMSGDNFQVNSGKARVVIRDHNLAFLSPLPEKQFKKILENFMRAERFSRTTMIQLRQLNDKVLQGLFSATATDEPLLDEKQIADVMERRAVILSRVQALIDIYGHEKVLAFP